MDYRDTLWQEAPPTLVLPPEAVHVWRVQIAPPPTSVQHALHALLSRDENEKAARFYFEKDRQRFIVSHAALRILLARYLGIAPLEARQLAFCLNAYGKPALPEAVSRTLTFNISHSQDLALLAFAHIRQLGVDVEHMRPLLDYETLAQHYFSSQECAVLFALPLAVRQEAFYQCWTRKEAYIKARGLGLALPLNSFDVSIHPAEPAQLLADRTNPDEAVRWKLHALQPGTGYVGALAVETREPEDELGIACWQLIISQEKF